MTVKRRIVWLADDDWTRIQTTAQSHGYTVSEYLRRLTNGHDINHSTWDSVKAVKTDQPVALKGGEGEPVPAPRPLTQAERDAILRRVNRGEG